MPARLDAPGTEEIAVSALVEQSEESECDGPPDSTHSPCPCSKLKKESSVVSPLHIMAAAFTKNDTSFANQNVDTAVPHLPLDAIGRRGNENSINKRLIEYFSKPTSARTFCSYSLSYTDPLLSSTSSDA